MENFLKKVNAITAKTRNRMDPSTPPIITASLAPGFLPDSGETVVPDSGELGVADSGELEMPDSAVAKTCTLSI